MPELPSEELLAALERAALLARWLEALKGEPLQPALRAEDRLDGLGALAAWLAAEPIASSARDALADGTARARWSRWLERRQDGPWLRRQTAVLMHGWGEGAAARGELDRARFWFEQSLANWRQLAEATPEAWAIAWPEGAGRGASLQGEVVGRLARWHADKAEAAFAGGEWPRARSRWHVLRGALGGAPPAIEEALVGRLVSHSRGVEQSGAGRGEVVADPRVLELLGEGLELAPDAAALHLRRVEVGARSARYHYALDDWDRFEGSVALMSPSLDWLKRHRASWEEAAAPERERVAEAQVCRAAASERPAEAVQALREALHLSPHHPTARDLLGQALAALAARSLGRGRVAAADAALTEARSILGPSPELTRLTVAVAAAVKSAEARARDAPVWDLTELDDG